MIRKSLLGLALAFLLSAPVLAEEPARAVGAPTPSVPDFYSCLLIEPMYPYYGCLKVRPEGIPEDYYGKLIELVKRPLKALGVDLKVCLGDCYCKEPSLVLKIDAKKDGNLYKGEFVVQDEFSGKQFVSLELSPVADLDSLLAEVGYSVVCSAVTSVSNSTEEALKKFELGISKVRRK